MTRTEKNREIFGPECQNVTASNETKENGKVISNGFYKFNSSMRGDGHIKYYMPAVAHILWMLGVVIVLIGDGKKRRETAVTFNS